MFSAASSFAEQIILPKASGRILFSVSLFQSLDNILFHTFKLTNFDKGSDIPWIQSFFLVQNSILIRPYFDVMQEMKPHGNNNARLIIGRCLISESEIF